MKKVFGNWRYYVIIFIGLIVVFGILGIPDESLPICEWILKFMLSKTVGFVSGYGLFRLIAYWESKNLVPELSKMIAEE